MILKINPEALCVRLLTSVILRTQRVESAHHFERRSLWQFVLHATEQETAGINATSVKALAWPLSMGSQRISSVRPAKDAVGKFARVAKAPVRNKMTGHRLANGEYGQAIVRTCRFFI